MSHSLCVFGQVRGRGQWVLGPGIALSLAIWLAGCRAGAGASDFVVLNGDADRPAVPITATIVRGAPGGDDDLEGRGRWSDLRKISSVRLRNDDGGSEFRQAAAIAVLPDGGFLAVDKRIGEVSHFAEAGLGRSVLPRNLKPDFRLLTPTSLARHNAGVWFVGDWSSTIKLFKEAQQGWAPAGTIPTEGIVSAACSLGDRVVVRGAFADGSDVHEYALDGEITRRYSSSYKHWSAIVRPSMSAGLVACGPGRPVIVTVTNAFPFVQGYSRDGKLLWTTEITKMRLNRVAFGHTPSGQDSVRHERDAINDTPASLTYLTDELVLFQFVRVQKSAVDQMHATVHSVVLSATTGRGAFVISELPLVLAASWPRLYTTSVSDPTTVAVYELNR